MQSNNTAHRGYLHTNDRKIVDGEGEPILLKGWSVGNWFNPEGFMLSGALASGGFVPNFKLPDRYDRGRSMDAVIRELCGEKYAKNFWPRWYENFFAEGDIQFMAEMNCNSVRVPISARAFLQEEPGITFNEHSFSVLDAVINWCEQYGLYAILDMHGAVGGQSGVACDDGIDNQAHMFTEEESAERTIQLWEEICRRYRDRWGVGAYDLLNEPISLPTQQCLVPQLRAFYEKLIARIRAIDTNHMLTIEGNAFSADNRVFFGERFDPECNNWCIHFHQYGYSPEARSLYKFLERSICLDVPLWLGETRGPIPNMTVYYHICESLDIGYNLWSWKVADADPAEPNEQPAFGGCPTNFALPEGWHAIREYITYGTKRPPYKMCIQIFDELLENVKFENCRKDRHIFDSVMRLPGTVLPAAGYDHAGFPGKAFSGNWPYGNPFCYRTEDHTKLVLRPGCTGPLTGPTRDMAERHNMDRELLRSFTADPLRDLMLELNEGEFAEYTFRNARADCQLCLQVSSSEESVIWIGVNGTVLSAETVNSDSPFPLRVQMKDAVLSGEDTVRVKCKKGRIFLYEIMLQKEK